ncbi:aldehyde dehydrogenase family protein [Mycobacterium xenopi 3993]|nr:aldehyde dehydrogenase family protein [Mycobacterium xenopi 3993]
MREYLKFYIDGRWVDPVRPQPFDVENPATEQVSGRISLGSGDDVDAAVTAARRAFASWSQSSREERLELMQAILAEYQRRADDLAEAVTEEMGLRRRWPPVPGAARPGSPDDRYRRAEEFCVRRTARRYPGGQRADRGMRADHPVELAAQPDRGEGVSGAGDRLHNDLETVRGGPYSAYIFTEILDAAGVPAGVYNLVNGDGAGWGGAVQPSRHRHGVVYRFDACRHRRGGEGRADGEAGHPGARGKSPNIVLDDAEFENSVRAGVANMMLNTGQSCNAPSRMLVPKSRMAEAVAVARETAEQVKVGDPDDSRAIGPLASRAQFEKVQRLIQTGIDEGATLVTGGPGRPDGLTTGYYAKPTVFADVTNAMTIAREEIFGPVLCILGYDDIDQAVEIANDTDYGLAGYVSGADLDKARAVASRIRAGWVTINHAFDMNAPFGGYKCSGNGREWSEFGFHEYLETKAILGYASG